MAAHDVRRAGHAVGAVHPHTTIEQAKYALVPLFYYPVLASACLLNPATQAGSGPPPADTVDRTGPVLSAPATTSMLRPGRLTFMTGYASPFRAAEPGSVAPGTGNQSYEGEIGWGVSRRLGLHLGVEVNDDPTYGPVRGARREKSLVTGALAARTVLGRWRAGVGPPPSTHTAPWPSGITLSLGLQGTAQVVWQGSEPGLFNAGAERDERVFVAAALALPFTLRHRGGASLSLAPSVAVLPDRVMGADYYGSMARLGAQGLVVFGREWTLAAAGTLMLGPGDNVVDRDGRFRRTPTWRLGIRWQATRRVMLDGHLTNAAGVTPATNHLTLASDPRTLYGVGITYSPSPAEPAPPVAPRSDAAQADGTGGVMIPPHRTLTPGRGRVESVLDSRGAWGLHFAHALGQHFQIELLATRLRGPDARHLLEAGVASSWEYRIAGQLALADEARGDPLSWSHRVSIGRDWDDQQGYLLAEIIASRRAGRGLRLVLNPLVAHTGGRSPVSVGVGARVDGGPVAVLPEWRGSVTGERPVWSLGLAPSGGQPGAHRSGRRGLDVRAFVTNAGGPRELGRVLADPRGFRVGVVLGVGF